MKFRTLLTILFCLLFTISVHAETEYMCGNIPFVPNKPPKESCGWRCGQAKATTNYLVISPEDYAKYSYQKAKNMYTAGKCQQVYTIKKYIDECGGHAVVKRTTTATWTETTGGSDICRMKQYQNAVQKQREMLKQF